MLDLTTMGHALGKLSDAYRGDNQWHGGNPQQISFLNWYRDNREHIAGLGDLEALAATDYEVLNSFLVSRGFEPLFRPFPGVGVASILDMLVEWAVQAQLTTINRFSAGSIDQYTAFELSRGGVDVFTVRGREHPLVCLRTKTGHKLWLMKAYEPIDGLGMALMAQRILTAQRSFGPENIDGVRLPTIEINTKPDLNWMIGCSMTDANGLPHSIEQAFQQFRLRINQEGARVKVATGFAARGGPVTYEFNEPFLGFFTQPGNEQIALAPFYADTDSWLAPKGSLADL